MGKARKSRRKRVAMGVLLAPLLVVGLLSPPSPSGYFYLLAIAFIWLSPWVAERVPRTRRRWVRRVGPFLFAATFVTRMLTPTAAHFTYEQVGARSIPRLALARLAHERDLSGGASTMLNELSILPPRGQTLRPLFEETYDLMDAADEGIPSPLLATLLLGQTPESFDLLRYDVEDARGTLVFLHGFGGSIASICWEVAQSAKAAGYETLCPSTRTAGDWGSADGAAIALATLAERRSEGPVVLAGLSAGARGAAVLAARRSGHIDGLVLIAGAARVRGAGVPTTVIYGRSDAMFAPAVMRSYVSRTGARGVPLDGGHFIVLSRREAVRREITRFLRARLER